MKLSGFWGIWSAIALFANGCTTNFTVPYLAVGTNYETPYRISLPSDFLRGYPTFNSDSTLNAIVEIPAGTSEKWELSKEGKHLDRDFSDGNPRTVKYLPYPANYGMVPQTVLAKNKGGDGDPLDVVILCEALPRASVVKVKIIGVIGLKDRGERDDKIIALPCDSSYRILDVENLKELDEKFPGITEILKIWFLNYKGFGKMEFTGFGSPDDGTKLAKETSEDFENQANSFLQR